MNDELDVARFSWLLSPGNRGSAGIQRVLGHRHLLTMAGGDVYAEERGANRPIQSFHVADLFRSVAAPTDLFAEASIGYDIYRHRWGIVAVTNSPSSASAILLALSETEAPTESWKVYRLEPESAVPVSASKPVVSFNEDFAALGVTWRPAGRVLPEAPEPEEGRTEIYTIREADLQGRGAVLTTLLAGASASVPQPSFVSPNSGGGSAQTFYTYFNDAAGSTAITQASLLINSTFSGSSACWVWYDGVNNRLGLANDAGSSVSWVSNNYPYTSASNTQCTLNGANSYISSSGTQLYFAAVLSFNAAFGGTKALYTSATDSSGTSGWQVLGSWNVPTGNVAPGPTSISPVAGNGVIQTFHAIYQDTNGAAAITETHLLFNSILNGANACWVVYYPRTDQLYLANDAGTGLTGPATPGVATTLSNSQCTINVSNSYSSIYGAYVILSVQLSFNSSSFGGPRVGYTSARAGSLTSGWQATCDWVVPTTGAPPRPAQIYPSSGAGISSYFQASFSYQGGATAISQAHVMFNSTPSPVNSCWLIYDAATNQLGLVNDAGTAVVYVAIGTNSTLSNGQCSLNAWNSYVRTSDTTLTLYLDTITFAAGFGGTKATSMAVLAGGLNSGWQVMGSWSVPTNYVAPGPLSLSPSSGTGGNANFYLYVTEAGGAAGITQASLLVNSSLSGAGACWVLYSGSNNQLGLVRDDGTILPGNYLTVGTNNAVSNSQCVLNGLNSTITISGAQMTIRANVTFLTPFSGAKLVYGNAGAGSLGSGWEFLGTWTVP